jgi:hypothetical protein
MLKYYLSIVYTLWGISSYAISKDTHSYHHPANGNWNGHFSLAYGFPSILKFVLKYEDMPNVYSVKGLGPYHGKAEVTYKKRIGLVGSLFFNSLNMKFVRTIDTNHYSVKDLGLNGRLNLYAINNPTHQLYIGYGMGVTTFNNKMYNIFNGDTAVVATLLKNFDKTTSEATIGYRLFPKQQHFGLMAELGIGRTINIFRDLGAIDSFFQLGITYSVTSKKRNDLLDVFRW